MEHMMPIDKDSKPVSFSTGQTDEIPASQTSTELDRAITLERVKLLYASTYQIVIATLIAAICLLVVDWGWLPEQLLIGWFVYMVSTLVIRVVLHRQYRKHGQRHVKPDTWIRLYMAGTIITALGWGFAGSYMLIDDSLVHQMFTTILLAGLAAGALATLVSSYLIYFLYVSLLSAPLLIKHFSYGDNIHIVTATLVMLFIIVILNAASRLTNTIKTSIALRFEHDAILKTLENEKKQTDELNNNLRHEINERLKVENNLENSMSQLQATLESTTDGILVVDNNGQISSYNQNFIDLWRIPAAVIEQRDHEIVQHYVLDQLKEPQQYLTQTQQISESIDDNSADLIELRDGRLYERYSKHQKLGNKTIGRVWSYRDVTDRIQSEAALQEAKDNAETANQAKSLFLSRISHELRTPLNAILGFGHLLQLNSENTLSEEQHTYTNHICNAGEHLLTLIDELLDISKIESGKLNLTLEPVSTADIIRESIALIQPMTAEKNIQLIDNTQQQPQPYVLADQTRMKQVLVNLLSNAIKYNRDNGQVTLNLKQDQDSVHIEINDTGEGIPENMHGEIFQPFTRLTTLQNTSGTGIGLTISKKLIDLMNGRMGLTSKQHEGSSFWFELPISHRPPETKSADKLISTDTPYKTFDYNKHTILYIEDEPLNLALMKSIIKQIPNTELLSAETGEAGIALALKQKPDIILMDINLPGMSGYDALKLIKSEQQLAHIPVFAVSANAMVDEVNKGKQAGFHDYLVKPINIENTRLMLSNTLSLLETGKILIS